MKQRFCIDQAEPMALIEFWSIIKAARDGYDEQDRTQKDGERKTAAGVLSDELVRLSTQELGAFFLQARDLLRDGVAVLTEVFATIDQYPPYTRLPMICACLNRECNDLGNPNELTAWSIYQGRDLYETMFKSAAFAASAVCMLSLQTSADFHFTGTPAEAANDLYKARTGQSLVAEPDVL